MTFTPERIAATREILARATSGPVQVKHDYNLEGRTTIIGNVDGEYVDGKLDASYDFVCSTLNYGETDDPAKAKANTAAIVAAVNTLPAALDEIKRLSAELASAKEAHEATAADLHTWIKMRAAQSVELSRLKAERDEAVASVARVQSDREYVIGWNDGFDHALTETISMKFPAMLRKMWSGGEVQKWLDERISEARSFLSRMEGRKDG